MWWSRHDGTNVVSTSTWRTRPRRRSSPSCPGPLAAEWIERDQPVTSPSMAARVPARAGARPRACVIEDVDGNRFLDFNAGIAVTSTGHCHPEVVAAIEAQAAQLIHYCSSDFYPPVYAELCERLGPAGARSTARQQGVPHQLGHRGGRGVDQARPLPHRPAVRDRVPRRVPRPQPRQPVAHREQGEVPRRASARCCPACTTCPTASAGLQRGRGVQAPRHARRRSRRSSSSRSRARAATSSRPPGWLAGLQDAVRRARHPARRRRDPERDRPHRALLGGRARGHRARRAPLGQGPGQRPAARGASSPAPTS